MSDWRALCRAEGWDVVGQRIRVPLPGDRGHWVSVTEAGEDIILTARIARASRLDGVEDPLLLLWRRNGRSKLVAFHQDGGGSILGQARVDKAGLTAEELRVYIHTLANECDRVEHLLTGRDVE